MTDLEAIQKALSTPLEYATVQNPDGTFRNMTPEERANFNPTHVVTYGERNGVEGSFKTCLATGETIFTPLITFPFY